MIKHLTSLQDWNHLWLYLGLTQNRNLKCNLVQFLYTHRNKVREFAKWPAQHHCICLIVYIFFLLSIICYLSILKWNFTSWCYVLYPSPKVGDSEHSNINIFAQIKKQKQKLLKDFLLFFPHLLGLFRYSSSLPFLSPFLSFPFLLYSLPLPFSHTSHNCEHERLFFYYSPRTIKHKGSSTTTLSPHRFPCVAL